MYINKWKIHDKIYGDKCNSDRVVGIGKLVPKILEVSPSHDFPDLDASRVGLRIFQTILTQMRLEQLCPSSSLSMLKVNKRRIVKRWALLCNSPNVAHFCASLQ
jgi:hypothetical protein